MSFKGVYRGEGIGPHGRILSLEAGFWALRLEVRGGGLEEEKEKEKEKKEKEKVPFGAAAQKGFEP